MYCCAVKSNVLRPVNLINMYHTIQNIYTWQPQMSGHLLLTAEFEVKPSGKGLKSQENDYFLELLEENDLAECTFANTFMRNEQNKSPCVDKTLFISSVTKGQRLQTNYGSGYGEIRQVVGCQAKVVGKVCTYRQKGFPLVLIK